MITVFSDKHQLRNAKTELYGGQLVAPFESPSRAEIVLERVKSEKLGEVIEPQDFGIDPALALHDAGFVEFLQNAWDEWSQTGFEGEAIPTCWPARLPVFQSRQVISHSQNVFQSGSGAICVNSRLNGTISGSSSSSNSRA